MIDLDQLRRKIGRLASLHGPGPAIEMWARKEGLDEIFVLPVLPSDTMIDVVGRIRRRGDAGVIVTLLPHMNDDKDEIEAVELLGAMIKLHEAHLDGTGCDLPITSRTTVATILSILAPGASFTARLDGDEFILQQGASADQIPVDAELLELASA